MLWNTPLVLLMLTHAGHENKGGSDVASSTRMIPYILSIAINNVALHRRLGKIVSEAVVAHRAIGCASPSRHATCVNART